MIRVTGITPRSEPFTSDVVRILMHRGDRVAILPTISPEALAVRYVVGLLGCGTVCCPNVGSEDRLARFVRACEPTPLGKGVLSVWHRCYTCRMPTKRRRHAITETPPVQAALDELRQELGNDGVELGELVVLGAGVKLEAIRSERDGDAAKRRRLADRVRSRATGADVEVADEVRSSGWART
jgi:hypothetical protein